MAQIANCVYSVWSGQFQSSVNFKVVLNMSTIKGYVCLVHHIDDQGAMTFQIGILLDDSSGMNLSDWHQLSI